jgi:hypothetical protein
MNLVGITEKNLYPQIQGVTPTYTCGRLEGYSWSYPTGILVLVINSNEN